MSILALSSCEPAKDIFDEDAYWIKKDGKMVAVTEEEYEQHQKSKPRRPPRQKRIREPHWGRRSNNW